MTTLKFDLEKATLYLKNNRLKFTNDHCGVPDSIIIFFKEENVSHSYLVLVKDCILYVDNWYEFSSDMRYFPEKIKTYEKFIDPEEALIYYLMHHE